jgi:hypothetical protein
MVSGKFSVNLFASFAMRNASITLFSGISPVTLSRCGRKYDDFLSEEGSSVILYGKIEG